jgi:UDP-GlcNAc:undecaprenyl-phosphate/decaprenyl-phosphate GlcNAc-1-phosphate transferase
LREYLLVLLATAFITYLTTPIARYAALRFGFMATVRDRDVHDRPIPRLGGLAMVAGLLAGLSLASQLPLISNVFNDGSQIRALLAGAGILVLLGVIDDKWSIDGPVKLAGQTLAAAVMASQGISLIWLPLTFCSRNSKS